MSNHSFVSEWIVYDTHTESHASPTTLQLGLLWVWIISLFLFLARFTANRSKTSRRDAVIESGRNPADEKPTVAEDADKDKAEHAGNNVAVPAGGNHGNHGNGARNDQAAAKQFSQLRAPPELNEFLLYIIQLGVIMLFFYYSDYIKVFPREARSYSRDTFLFVVFLLFLVGTVFTTRTTSDKILNRDITEEWKGWMQVMFVWYHYFMATEWYNWIRIYIAAYVWMTGFGNFSFFWIKKDYSLWRAMKMLFRLNFLVLVICAAVSNPYMLYYICPMHTYWFLSVYAFMGILPSWNEDRKKMALKFVMYGIINAIIFEVPGLTDKLFYPLWPILGLKIGKSGVMHEWSFRLGLDHWVCFIGMLCAYNYPYFEAFLLRIEQRLAPVSSRWKEILIKLSISLPILIVYLLWHSYGLNGLEKYAYNRVHPYTSFIPIIAFIWFRNLFPILRTHYVHLFAELGKITLETYLSQLHAYLQSNAKELLAYISGYPLLNFSFNTIVYLGISHTLFSLTMDISAYILPRDQKLMRWRLMCVGLTLAAAFVMGLVSRLYLSVFLSYL